MPSLTDNSVWPANMGDDGKESELPGAFYVYPEPTSSSAGSTGLTIVPTPPPELPTKPLMPLRGNGQDSREMASEGAGAGGHAGGGAGEVSVEDGDELARRLSSTMGMSSRHFLTPQKAKARAGEEQRAADVPPLDLSKVTGGKKGGGGGKESGEEEGESTAGPSQVSRNSKPLLNPRSGFLRYWDVYLAGLLAYTGLVTPFEVAFLEVAINVLFFFNRIVDISFVGDMCIQFMLPVQDKEGNWVNDPVKIAKKYLQSWFFVDLISVLPYDVLGLSSGSEETTNLKVLRILRLMRLVKMLRILRAGRMFQRWEATMTINYSKLELFKFGVVLFAIAHWLGCAWQMVGSSQEETCPDGEECPTPLHTTWATSYFQGLDGEAFRHDPGLWETYMGSVYWAVATLSTIGYGDVIPITNLERGFVIVAAMMGATTYAYMVGSICSIVQGMDRESSAFYALMDTLNGFMEDKKVPFDLRVKLRDFFRFRRGQRGPADFEDIFKVMSPTLRAEVSQHINSKWINNVKCFKGCSDDFVVAVAMNLNQQTYGSNELVITPGQRAMQMYIIDRGFVMAQGRAVTTGGTFGEDMIFRSTSAYIRNYNALTVNNTVLLTLSKANLLAVLEEFPQEKKRLRKWVVKMVFRNTLMEYSRGIRKLEKMEGQRVAAEAEAERMAAARKKVLAGMTELGMSPEGRVHFSRRASDAHISTINGKRAALRDPTLVPIVYLKKLEQRRNDPVLNEEYTEIVIATTVIQRNVRSWKLRKAARGRAKRELALENSYPRLRSLLRSLALEEEVFPILERNLVGYDNLEDMDLPSMVAMGIRWGDANVILRIFKVANESESSLDGGGKVGGEGGGGAGAALSARAVKASSRKTF